MIKKIRNYVEQIFEEYPKTKKARELKDELVANLIEKYNDLLAQEKSEEDAYNIVIASIGDINELIGDLDKTNNESLIYIMNERKKNAKYIATAIMLYIVSVVPVIYFDMAWGNDEIGVIMMFFIVAIATGLLVYVGVSKPKNFGDKEVGVREFTKFSSTKKHQNYIRSTILSAFWVSILAIYFIISFAFESWAYSWIIFIVGIAINQIIIAVFEMRGE